MADISKTVQIIFGASDETAQGVESAVTGLGKVDAAVTAAAAPFAAFADGILKADTALAALAVGGLALSVREASKFNDSFNEINTLAGTTGAATTKFKDDIISFAQGSTQSLDKITGSTYQAISMGLSWQDSLKGVAEAEKLSVVGRGDLTKTTELLIGTMNAYGVGMDQATKFSDVFFTTVKDGKTTIPELAASMAQVTGSAAGAKIPIETLMAAIAALTVSGKPTAEAITGIRAAIDNIVKPSGEAEKMAAQLGIRFDATALQTKGLDGVLKDVMTSTKGNVTQIHELFGSTEAYNSMLILARDSSGKFAQALTDMKNSAGAVDEKYKEMVKNIEFVTQNMKNNVEAVLVDIGKRILPTYSSDISALSEVFKGIKISIDQGAFDPLFQALNSAGDSVKQLLDGIAKAFPEAMKQVDFTRLIQALKDLGISFGTLFDNFDPTDPDQLAKAIQFVVDTIESLVKVTQGMVEEFKPFLDGIINSVDGFNKLDEAGKLGAGNIAMAAKGIVDAGVLIVGAMATIGQNADAMKGTFDLVLGGIKAAWDLLLITVDTIVIAITGLFEGIVIAADKVTFGQFSGELSGIEDGLAKFRQSYQGAFIENSDKATENITRMGKGIGELAGSAVDSAAKVQVLGDRVEYLPGEKTIKTQLTYEEALAQVEKVTTGLDKIPANKDVTIGATADETALNTAKNKLGQWIPDSKGVLVLTGADPKALMDTKKALDTNIPKEKPIDVQTKLDIAAIEAQTKQIDAYFKFRAEVDVAQIKAAAEVSIKAFESLNETIKGTSGLLDTLFGMWKDAGDIDRGQIESWINTQLDNQKRALDLQTKLTEAQIDYYKNKSKALSSGDALIKLETTGLEPEIEAFMFKILAKIQLRVAQEQSDFLLGLK